ncbi:hypothetical protein GCM10023178_63850 [Actinomadura luteofluorescens]
MTNATGSMITPGLPYTSGSATVVTRPMSWKTGSQFTPDDTRGTPSNVRHSCSAFVAKFPCVMITPAGVRVEPEVYCR